MNDSRSSDAGTACITKENLLFAFPVGLRETPHIAALGDITAEALAERPAEISRVSIYPRIRELPEDLLDILAYDFKVDWWNPDYTLEEKRRTLADSWRVHKLLGTKAAVETALRAIYPRANVREWFEYEGGEPYHFKLDIDLTGEASDQTRPWQALERVNFYKSLRSHVDEIEFTFVLPPATLHVGGGVGAHMWMGVPLEPDVYDFQDTLHMGGSFGARPEIAVPNEPDSFHFRDTLHTGGAVGARPEIGIPNEPDSFRFRDTLHTGGTVGAVAEIAVPSEPDSFRFRDALHAGGAVSGQTALPVPEDPAQPSATTILRTGGVCTIISNLPPTKGE